jgi:hypothetical protein
MNKSTVSHIAMAAGILAAFLSSANSVGAASSHNMQMTIPFDFFVAEKLMARRYL